MQQLREYQFTKTVALMCKSAYAKQQHLQSIIAVTVMRDWDHSGKNLGSPTYANIRNLFNKDNNDIAMTTIGLYPQGYHAESLIPAVLGNALCRNKGG